MVDQSYSAFGSTAPLFDPPGQRVRWCCPLWIKGETELKCVLETAAQAGEHHGTSRISVRVFSEMDLASRFESLVRQSGFNVEAVIDPGRADRCQITYLGYCDGGRRDAEADAVQEQALVESVIAQPAPEIVGPVGKLETPAGFELQDCSGHSFSASDTAVLIRMHRRNFARFPYSFQEKLSIMRDNPETYLQAVLRSRRDGEIYAFSNLELNTVTLDDGRGFLLAEYDNTMRRTSLRNRYPAADGIGRTLRLKLAMMAAGKGVDFCYSESRAGLVAINQISHQIGMNFGGKLLKHLLIAGQSDIQYQAPSPFESMNVWYFDQARLAFLKAADS